MRVGIGYDVHKLVEDRDLIIGGVKIDQPISLPVHQVLGIGQEPQNRP